MEYKALIASISEMVSDIEAGSLSYQNIKTVDFLRGLEAWLIDTNGGKDWLNTENRDDVFWKDVETLLKAAAVYE